MKAVVKFSIFKLAVVGSGISLVSVFWFHVGCFDMKVFPCHSTSYSLFPIVVRCFTYLL